jgi:hypothetical protein
MGLEQLFAIKFAIENYLFANEFYTLLIYSKTKKRKENFGIVEQEVRYSTRKYMIMILGLIINIRF